MDLYAKRTFLIDTENAFKIGSHIAALNTAGHSVIKLNLGEPDFDVPEFIKAEIKRQLDNNNTHYYSIASIPGMEKRTIISSGFSKAFSWTGGRVGYAVFPTIEEADIFKNLNINYFSCVPPYNQEAARVALEHADSQKSVLQMVKVLQERRDYIVKALNDITALSCNTPSCAFYVFPNIKEICEHSIQQSLKWPLLLV